MAIPVRLGNRDRMNGRGTWSEKKIGAWYICCVLMHRLRSGRVLLACNLHFMLFQLNERPTLNGFSSETVAAACFDACCTNLSTFVELHELQFHTYNVNSHIRPLCRLIYVCRSSSIRRTRKLFATLSLLVRLVVVGVAVFPLLVYIFTHFSIDSSESI